MNTSSTTRRQFLRHSGGLTLSLTLVDLVAAPLVRADNGDDDCSDAGYGQTDQGCNQQGTAGGDEHCGSHSNGSEGTQWDNDEACGNQSSPGAQQDTDQGCRPGNDNQSHNEDQTCSSMGDNDQGCTAGSDQDNSCGPNGENSNEPDEGCSGSDQDNSCAAQAEQDEGCQGAKDKDDNCGTNSDQDQGCGSSNTNTNAYDGDDNCSVSGDSDQGCGAPIPGTYQDQNGNGQKDENEPPETDPDNGAS